MGCRLGRLDSSPIKLFSQSLAFLGFIAGNYLQHANKLKITKWPNKMTKEITGMAFGADYSKTESGIWLSASTLAKRNTGEFSGIRKFTSHDIEDAQSVIREVYSEADEVFEVLWVGLLHVQYAEKKNSSFEDVISFLFDPGFDDSSQVLMYMANAHHYQKNSHPAIKKIAESLLEKDDSGTVVLQNIFDNAKRVITNHLEKQKNPLLFKEGENHQADVPVAPLTQDIEVFFESSIQTMRNTLEAVDRDAKHYGASMCKKLEVGKKGFRSIPQITPELISPLFAEFENMLEPLSELTNELTLNVNLPPYDFLITPMLFLGAPGIGKTALANALSKTLGVPFKKCKGSEPSFYLTGSHRTWRQAAPGKVIEQLISHDSASPLFFVDELEKKGDQQFPISNALLDLLEPENARNFKDEFFDTTFNASHVIWILAANTTDDLPDSLLSRLNIFEIPTPGFEQRLRIILQDFKNLNQKTNREIEIRANDADRLAERTDLDIRQVSRVVRDSFIAALRNDVKTAKFEMPKYKGKRIGFISN